jgi:hypothetical protein
VNKKIKIEIGAVVIAIILVVGVLTFSLNSYIQSADAKKDKYDKLRESLRKQAEATAGISDRGDVDILGSNKTILSSNTNTSSATVIDGADGINGIDAGVNGADGISANGVNVIGADGASDNGE